jgi:hypothetical protein
MKSAMFIGEKLISPENSKFIFLDELKAEEIYSQRLDDEKRKSQNCRLS